MPAPRVRDEWEPWVKQIAADNPRWGAERVRKRLEEEADSLTKRGTLPGWQDRTVPSDSTIKRILADFTEEERVHYARFRWPESMERSALPWEASAAALELLAVLDRQGHHQRPPIRIVRWWWRVSLAAPGAPVSGRFWAALTLATNEALGRNEGELRRGLEWWLAYGPWRGPEWTDAYRAALMRESPVPARRTGIAMPAPGDDLAALADIQWALSFAFGRKGDGDE